VGLGQRFPAGALVLLAPLLACPAASAQTGVSRIVLATATDSRNQPLTNLGEDDFVVREAGAAREVFGVRLADYPIVLLVDNGVASREDFEAIRKATARFVARIGAQRPVALGTLADPPAMITTFDDDRAKVTAAIEALAPTQAASLLFQSVANAAQVIRATGSPFAAIVIISASQVDATPNPPGELFAPILDSRAIVHVVIKGNANPAAIGQAGTLADMLRALADQTRGQYTAIFSAVSYQAALDQLAGRLLSEMMIEFIEPEGAVASDDVKVGVRVPGARVTGLGVSK
jgi:hypothetical protein